MNLSYGKIPLSIIRRTGTCTGATGRDDEVLTDVIPMTAVSILYFLTHFSEVTSTNALAQSNLRVSSGFVFRF